MIKRAPAVAGSFYPEAPASLTEEIKKCVDEDAVKSKVLGVVSPHAGFMYSGAVAGAVFSRIEIPETVIVLGPNHTGRGERISIMTQGVWSMPFGDVEIDRELAEAIRDASPGILEDSLAHEREHSLETQLPFMQYFRKDFKIVPICLMGISLEICDRVSRAIAVSVRKLNRSVLIVASSDMTHYESHLSAAQKDSKAIEKIIDLDPQGLYETVRNDRISMCGVNPVTVMLMCAKRMGAERSELVKYMTSGEVSGDMDHVVGYAGVIVK